MRPIELIVKDFRSFQGKHRFSFAGRRLVAVAGPIGAGKTSILDAIAFALYGQTPKLGRQPAALINQDAGEMTVRLRFLVGEAGWEVERLARRRGAGTAALYPYSEPDGRNPLEMHSGARNVNARVEEILGMDFAAFSRSILLPQGEFAQFLLATAAEKDRVLKGVFGLERIDRMRQLARERALAAALDVARVADELEESVSAAAELEELEPMLENAAARAAAVGELQTQAAALDSSEQKLAAALESLDSAACALSRAADRLRPEKEIAAAVAVASDAAQKKRASAGLVRAAREKMESAESELARFLGELDGEAGLERAREAVAELAIRRKGAAESSAELEGATRARADSHRELERLEHELEEAAAAASARERSLRAVRRELEIARAQVEELERADMALTLREHLARDDECPVCGRLVSQLPEAHAHPDLDTARRRFQGAAADQDHAGKALADAREEAAALEATRHAAAAQADEDQGAFDKARDRAAESTKRLEQAAETAAVLLSSKNPETALADLDSRLADLRRAAAGAGAEFASSVAAEADVRAAGEAARAEAQALELELSVIAGEMGVRPDATDLPEMGVAELAGRLRDHARARRRELARERDSIKQQEAKLADERRDLLVRWDLPAGEGVNDFAARVHAEAATLRARERELGQKAARGPDLARAKRELERRRRHLERLVEDLRDSRFLKYMLAGKRAQLAEFGGERIRELTGGRFGFSPGDRFEIVDFGAADPDLRVRSSDTLSGGETFLASLSLALALADLVAGQGGRLGSFFLDEGFGSLDADHLAIAMDGIERLASEAEDRLVVVVSHVPGVQERVEDQIVLGAPAGPGGGSRIVSGAVPA
ncbi:MAG: SMC family ATPase [Chloroflexi bacterium]|nr:SMC family ATPase [Chloroflexota bacterium]MYC48437.1 SMC family ATPase [Chloroflexota bacterium]